ncbi:MAG: hypothetical protein SGARI_001634, partial [Bacillariaceae sp.]
MTNGTAFVINLAKDKARMQSFQKKNQKAMSVIQRFPAHQWWTKTRAEAEESSGAAAMESWKVQQEWEPRYPFLKIATQTGKYGDAACALSHLLLWKEKLLDNKQTNTNTNDQDDSDYLFVFEDDAQLLEPLLSGHSIVAPDLADIVFLASPALKRVDVPWKAPIYDPTLVEKLGPVTTHVVGGYGAWGYIITRRGVQKMLEFMRRSVEPTDISLFLPADVRVFLPIQGQWPA